MNNIIEKQNTKSSIDRLFAQRKLYSQVKLIFYIRLSIALLIATVGPIFSILFLDKKGYVALFAVFYLCFELLLEKIEKDKRANAAKIQELFDVEIFGLKWNLIVVGQKPEQEVINSLALNVKKEDILKLNNWYPAYIKELPLSNGIIICQKSNIWWDQELRKKLVGLMYLFLLLITVSVIFLNLDNLVSVFLVNSLPLIPLYKVVISQIISHNKTINSLKSLKEKLDSILENILEVSVSNEDLRLIQDEIYRHRINNHPVPDFFYKLFRNKSEKIMNITAEQQVERILYDQAKDRQTK